MFAVIAEFRFVVAAGVCPRRASMALLQATDIRTARQFPLFRHNETSCAASMTRSRRQWTDQDMVRVRRERR